MFPIRRGIPCLSRTVVPSLRPDMILSLGRRPATSAAFFCCPRVVGVARFCSSSGKPAKSLREDLEELMKQDEPDDESDSEFTDKFVQSLSAHNRAILANTLAPGAKKVGEGKHHHKHDPAPRPTNRQLGLVALNSGLPFVGFGFLDNFLMIVCGDYIDKHLGAMLGISAMAAAALGNLISDVFGLGAGGYIEAIASRLGLPDPEMTRAQTKLRISRLTAVAGNSIGIIIGCLLGMCPLLWMTVDVNRELEQILHSTTYIEAARLAFDQADANKNGKIDREEMVELARSFFASLGVTLPGGTPPADYVDVVFRLFDHEGDGSWTFEEYLEFTQAAVRHNFRRLTNAKSKADGTELPSLDLATQLTSDSAAATIGK